MSKIRVCFLGTPDFAVTCLQRVLSDEHYDVVGVVTQPDRPSGRKMILTPSPVKQLAEAKGLRVISPESVNKDFILNEIQNWGAEVAIVVAFGQILSQKFLDLFPRGAVNVHGSLLPKWRGAAPIQRSLEAGEKETGVVLQKVVKALDAGDVLGIRRIALDSEITASELFQKLAVLGADTLHLELMDYLRGNLAPMPQDHSQATYAKKIDKAEAELDWTKSAERIHDKVRAFDAGPGTWTLLNGKKLKIHRTRFRAEGASKEPGRLLKAGPEHLDVATGSGVLEILELQPESRNRMRVADFLKANPVKEGDFLGR